MSQEVLVLLPTQVRGCCAQIRHSAPPELLKRHTAIGISDGNPYQRRLGRHSLSPKLPRSFQWEVLRPVIERVRSGDQVSIQSNQVQAR